jgi:hypothetical protein
MAAMRALIWIQRYLGNPIVVAILRSPVHWILSGRVMLLTVVGRRTGRRYTIPVWYTRQNGTLDVLVAGKQVKTWWKNLEGGAPVELLLRRRLLAGIAEALTFEQDPRRFTAALRNYVAANPRGAGGVGIRDVEHLAGLRSATGRVTMVIIRLAGAPSKVP